MKTTADYHPLAILIAILLISSICVCPVAAQTKTDSVTIQSEACASEKVIDNFVIKVKNYVPYIGSHEYTSCPILQYSACDINNWNNYDQTTKNMYCHCSLDYNLSNLSQFERLISYITHGSERVRNEKCSGDDKCYSKDVGESENALKGTLRVSYYNNLPKHEFVAEISFTPESLITQRDGRYTKQFTIYPEDRYKSPILNLKIDLNYSTNEEITIAESIVRMVDTSENLENLGILINAAPSYSIVMSCFSPDPLGITSAYLTIPITYDLSIHPYFIGNILVGPATPEMIAQIKTTADLQAQINDEVFEYN